MSDLDIEAPPGTDEQSTEVRAKFVSRPVPILCNVQQRSSQCADDTFAIFPAGLECKVCVCLFFWRVSSLLYSLAHLPPTLVDRTSVLDEDLTLYLWA